MFKKTIKFENFDGEEVERDFYFHLSKAELIAMAGDGKTMQDRIKRIMSTNDSAAIIEEFRALIRLSVGIRTEDGERFTKSPEAQSYLLDSPAFDELLFELITKENASVDFVKQLIPEKLQKELQDKMQQTPGAPDPFGDAKDGRPAYQRENRRPNADELQAMTKTELVEAMAWQQSHPQ